MRILIAAFLASIIFGTAVALGTDAYFRWRAERAAFFLHAVDVGMEQKSAIELAKALASPEQTELKDGESSLTFSYWFTHRPPDTFALTFHDEVLHEVELTNADTVRDLDRARDYADTIVARAPNRNPVFIVDLLFATSGVFLFLQLIRWGAYTETPWKPQIRSVLLNILILASLVGVSRVPGIALTVLLALAQ